MRPTYYERIGNDGLASIDVWSGMFPDSVHISRIRVTEKYRGQGHGTRLLKTVLEEAKEESLDVTLHVEPDHPSYYLRLKSWYERLGFYQSEFGSMLWSCEGQTADVCPGIPQILRPLSDSPVAED